MTTPDRNQTAERIKAYHETYTKKLPSEVSATLLVAEALFEIAGALKLIDSRLHALDNTVRQKK